MSLIETSGAHFSPLLNNDGVSHSLDVLSISPLSSAESKVTKETKSQIDIGIASYTLDQLSTIDGKPNESALSIIRVYQEVFRGEPWNQYRQCTDASCGQAYSEKKYNELYIDSDRIDCICVTCEQARLGDPHTKDSVWQRMSGELSHPNSFLFVAIDNSVDSFHNGSNIVGFMWGFGDSSSQVLGHIFDDYLPGFSEETREVISEKAFTDWERRPETLSYMSELGVTEGYRGKDIPTRLIRKALQKQIPEGYDNYLFWTSKGKSQNERQSLYGLTSEDYVLVGGDGIALEEVFRDRSPLEVMKYGVRHLKSEHEALYQLRHAKKYNGSEIYPIMLGLGGKEVQLKVSPAQEE